MKKVFFICLVILFAAACVGPEELYDGLVKNIPTVVNTNDVFTYAIKAENYDFNQSYDLAITGSDTSFLLTTLLITGAGDADTVSITFYDADNTVLWPLKWAGDLVYTAMDSLTNYHPKSVRFNAKDYTGEIQCVLVIEK